MTPIRSKGLILWLLFAVVALIAYGSLYPFNFKPDAVEGGILDALRELSWVRAGRSDHISNVLLYIPLGLCLFLLLKRRSLWLTALIVAVIGATLSLVIEVAQVFISPRVPSLTDLSLNTAGALAGAVAGAVWHSLSGLIRMPTVGGNRGDRIAFLTILLWLGWRFAPFVPQISLSKLRIALQPLFNPQIDFTAAFGYLACWLVVARALFTLISRPGTEALLALIAIVLVGRLLLAEQVFVPAELLALVALLPALVILHRLSAGMHRALLLVAIGAVFVFERLSPFEFVAMPGGFDLWPFLSWIDAGMPFDSRSLLAFLFFCCALIWLIRDAGLSLDTAIAIVVVGVFAIELLQMWQPDRTASITDPVLALALGFLLKTIEPRDRRALRFR